MTKKIQKKKNTPAKKTAVEIKKGELWFDKRYGKLVEIEKVTKTYIHTDYSGYGREEFEERFTKVEKSYEQLEQEAIEVFLKSPQELKAEPTNSTALMIVNKDSVIQLEKELVKKERDFAIYKSILEGKMNQLSSFRNQIEKQLKKVQQTIYTFELYLGVNEDIIQIQQGKPANENEPLQFRQKVLYIDEEIGDPTDQGFDFRKLPEFDRWLTVPKHLQQIIPEKKGVVIMRPRRHEKRWSENAFEQTMLAQYDKKSYIVIRNGDNLYRIWANIQINERLFPTASEIKKLYDEKESWADDRERQIFSYKQRVLLMQGLIDRTEIFVPRLQGVNLFQPETYGKHIRLIYDDEFLLPTGRKPFRDWQKDVNKTIQRGTRVLVIREHLADLSKKEHSRFSTYFNEYNFPPLPNTGIYSIEEVKMRKGAYYNDEKEMVKIIYNPKDTIYDNSWVSYWDRKEDHDRKKGLGFWFWKVDDQAILNYDNVSLDDIEFYLENRVEREDYLSMMPILRNIKKMRLQEIEKEKQFVEALAQRLPYENKQALTKLIWECVEWWKTKVIWKRPIMEDDSKAWRMITSRVKQTMEKK